jgi:hypothetical protein
MRKNKKSQSHKNKSVVDLFTKCTFEDIENAYKVLSDEEVRANGKYIGRLPAEKTEHMRARIDEINVLHHQLQHLLSEFESMRNAYRNDILSALRRLHISPDYYDLDKDELFISNEGHTYILRGDQLPNL